MRVGVGRRHEQRGYGQVLDLLQASLADAPTLHLDTPSASKRFDYTNHTEGKKHRVWFDDDETLAIKYRAVLDAGVAGIAMWTADATHRAGPSDTRAASTVSGSGCFCHELWLLPGAESLSASVRTGDVECGPKRGPEIEVGR